jgi:hypothetical protein
MDADAILLDRRGLSYPCWDQDVPLLDALLHRARAGDVHTSMVAGRLILRDRKLLFIDKAALLDEIAAALAKPPDASEVARRSLARAVLPYAEAFYADWHADAAAGCNCRSRTNLRATSVTPSTETNA